MPRCLKVGGGGRGVPLVSPCTWLVVRFPSHTRQIHTNAEGVYTLNADIWLSSVFSIIPLVVTVTAVESTNSPPHYFVSLLYLVKEATSIYRDLL